MNLLVHNFGLDTRLYQILSIAITAQCLLEIQIQINSFLSVIFIYITHITFKQEIQSMRALERMMPQLPTASTCQGKPCTLPPYLQGKSFESEGIRMGQYELFINLKLRGWAVSWKLVGAKGQQWYVWTADIPKLNYCMSPVSFVRVAVWLDHLYYFRYYLTRDFAGLYVEWIAVLFKCCGFHRFSHNPSHKLCSANMQHSHKVPTASRFQHTL